MGANLQDACEKNKTQRIRTWNVRTMLKTGKLENIKIEMKRLDIYILGLCEIRWPDNGDLCSDDIRVIHTNSTKGQARVGIALNKKWGKRVTNVVTYSSRLCLVKMESTPNINLAIIQVYMSTSKTDDEEVEEVYAGIEELMKHTKPHDNVIIMGDFNAIVGEGREGREVGDFGLGKRNTRGESVVEFCRENGMIITNTRFQNPKRRIYTWKMPGDIARYQIDYILLKNRFKKQVKFCKTYPSADCDSDHNIVIAKCELRYKKPQRTKVQQDNYNIRLLKRAEVVEEYGRYMDIKYQKQNVDDTLNKKKAWIGKEIVKLIDERRKYKNNNTREGQQKYRQLRNQVNREARKAKEEWLEQQWSEIDEMFKANKIDYAYHKIQQFVGKRKRNVTNIRDKIGQLLVDDEDIIKRWKEYIEELYEGEILEEITTNEKKSKLPILRLEFELALYDLKQNKAPGTDNITAELLQCASMKIKDALYQLTKDIYEKGDVPDDYCESIIVTIPKKSGANSCEQFRTLSLLTYVSKILTKIINRRIEGKVEQYLKNDQYGFRRQKGTREAILGITYLAFIDLEKAFDKVNWNKMLHILREIGIEKHDLRIIHSLYKNQKACIKKGEITTNVQIKKGVRQGCTLSPPLFNCYIEKVINIVKAKLTRLNIGIKIGGQIVSMIRFADDIVVIAESEGDIQRAAEEMDEMLRTSEMKINSKETNILVCARDPKVRTDVYIGNQKLEQVEEMVYLGSKITYDGKSVHEIKQRIAIAIIAFSKKHK
ncbi:hypothetical protein QTP88_000796 [Uroleucon formosanum]